MELIIIIVLLWVVSGLAASYVGWRAMCRWYGEESFWTPFYIITGIGAGVFNWFGVLSIRPWRKEG